MAPRSLPEGFPEQRQEPPGLEYKMEPQPEIISPDYKGSDKLRNKAALITGGDSGIGRAVAVHFAREGAGPIWTPLIPSTFKSVEKFGQNSSLGRAGQPSEVAPAYVFLASEDASYFSSQILYPNGGEALNT